MKNKVSELELKLKKTHEEFTDKKRILKRKMKEVEDKNIYILGKKTMEIVNTYGKIGEIEYEMNKLGLLDKKFEI